MHSAVMKKAIGIVLFFFSVITVQYSQYTSAKDSDPEAIRLLEKAGENMNSNNTQVTFSLRLSYPGEEGQPRTGVLYQRGAAYHLDLDTYSIISDGKTRWVYLKPQNEINIYDEDSGQDWISPTDFLQLQKAPDLVFVLAGTKADGSSIIEAKPLKGRFQEYSKFTIIVKNGGLSSIKALSRDGTRQEMYIGTITHPAAFADPKLFTFNKSQYPGVHIEDLRLD
jgi:outer membrane lipoprotein carrier protein